MILLLTFSCKAQKKDKIKGDREVISISEDIKDNFENIEISDNISVNLQKGLRTSYILTADRNLIEEVEIEVKNGTLKIYTKSNIGSSKKLEIYLSLKSFNSIIVNDDAIVKSSGKFEIEYLKVTMNNSSKIDLDLNVEKSTEINLFDNSVGKLSLRSDDVLINMKNRTDLNAKLKSKNLEVNLEKSAAIKLDGEADDASYNVEDTSNLDAKKLKSRTAVLNSKNRTDIYINAAKTIEITAEGKSKIYIYGNPTIKINGFVDKSRIIKK